MITSNRYISTKSGGDIRKFLLDNYDIIEIIDLGDTKLFNAAVLPAIFIGKKKLHKNFSSKVGKYTSIYEAEETHKNEEGNTMCSHKIFLTYLGLKNQVAMLSANSNICLREDC